MTTTTLALESWATGGCHCGKVRFKVWIERLAVIECNCSICLKKGFINIIAKPEHFELTQGEENLATYQFNTMVAETQVLQNLWYPYSYSPTVTP